MSKRSDPARDACAREIMQVLSGRSVACRQKHAACISPSLLCWCHIGEGKPPPADISSSPPRKHPMDVFYGYEDLIRNHRRNNRPAKSTVDAFRYLVRQVEAGNYDKTHLGDWLSDRQNEKDHLLVLLADKRK